VETGKRELVEETGYIAEKMTKICSFRHSSRTTQFCHAFLAEDLILSSSNHDEGELIVENVIMSPEEINKTITERLFVDISHICAWYNYSFIWGK
ncbi:MAG: NUDIX hydrolase, partial [Candidatus Hodarchaeales archaeon]